MGWKGSLIGAMVCGRGGFWGILFGSILGSYLENKFFPPRKSSAQRRAQTDSRSYQQQARRRAFCQSAGAVLAKMAKADGRVTRSEIASVEQAFARLGFSSVDRAQAVRAFRAAKDGRRSIYAYAEEMTSVVGSLEVRELFYELLWDLACADGEVSAAEDAILRMIPVSLRIPAQWYFVYARERRTRESARQEDFSRQRRHESPPPRDKLAEAYSILGVSAASSDEALRKAYRQKAKKYHPDTLRAQGLPDEMVGRATEQMARVNAAWQEIKSARGL